MKGVLEVQTYGEKLHIFVDETARRIPQIETALAAQGITLNGIRPIDVRMEEAFISIIRHQTDIHSQADVLRPAEAVQNLGGAG
jgi:hypothetical protein